MSSTYTTPKTAPDTRTIRESNYEADRIVAGFETPSDSFLRQHRGKLHLLAFLVALIWATPCFPQVLLGLPLVIIGLAIRAWAAGCLAKNTEVCTAGPYGYCRHPMYLANFTIVAGILLAANNFYLTVPALLATILLQALTVRREEALLHCLFGEDYTRYCQSTPRLLPWPRRSPISSCQFTWGLAKYNQIVEQTAGVLLLIVLFAVKAVVMAHYGYLYPVTYGLWPVPPG